MNKFDKWGGIRVYFGALAHSARLVPDLRQAVCSSSENNEKRMEWKSRSKGSYMQESINFYTKIQLFLFLLLREPTPWPYFMTRFFWFTNHYFHLTIILYIQFLSRWTCYKTTATQNSPMMIWCFCRNWD